MNLSQLRFTLSFTVPALVLALSACVSSESDEPAGDSSGSGGSSSTTTTTTAASNTTNTSSTSSDTTSTTGGGGTDEVSCDEKTTITQPMITDFETYDGATDAASWEFNFNGDADGVGAVYAGPFELKDGTGDYSLSFVAGADGSTWALSAQNDSAADWGGGIGFWMGCADASSYTGISFMLKGSTPAGTAGMAIELPGDVSLSSEFPVSADWTLVQLPFTGFTDDAGNTTDGSQIGAMSFSAHMKYVQDETMEWVPEPGAFEVTIDNLSFY